MGGRGSSSSTFRRQPVTAQQRPNPPQPPQPAPQVADQTPDANNTPVTPNALDALSQMSDDQLAQLYNASRNVQMPNHLSDVDDKTQRFVFQAGINGLPTVLDDASFSAFLKANGMSQSDVLARSVNGAPYTVGNTHYNLTAQQIADMMMYSKLNYIGGKINGQAYGGGTYFARTGGRSTGYNSGGVTVSAVLNPKTARPISLNDLRAKVPAFQRSHPKFAAAVGKFTTALGHSPNSTASIYALAMGYNVITDGDSGYNGYVNAIDRTALVYRK